jgi:hypothetical protein
MCLGVESFALVLNEMVGGIYSPNHFHSHW